MKVLLIIIGALLTMQLLAILAWWIKSRSNETSKLHQCAAGVMEFFSQVDRALGVILVESIRLFTRYAWIVSERVFTLFVWGVAAAALAAIGRVTDDWQLRITSMILFSFHGIAVGFSFGTAQEHLVSRFSAENERHPRVAAILTRIVGFLTSILFILWMSTVFAKLIQSGIA